MLRRLRVVPPLRLSLSIWVAVAIGVSAWIETRLSRRMATEIDAVSLQQESKELLKAYSAAMAKRWSAVPPLQRSSCCNQLQLNDLMAGLIPSEQLVPAVVIGDQVATPPGGFAIVERAMIQRAAQRLQLDEDRYIARLSATNPSRAVAAMRLQLEGVPLRQQPDLILITRWPLREGMDEIRRTDLLLRFITLALTIGASLLFLQRFLQPLRAGSLKASRLDHRHLLENQIDESSVPIEVREIVRAYNSSLRKLDEEYQLQQSFAGSLSHEFKTPLTAIGGYVESVLLHSKELTEFQSSSLSVALSESRRLNGLVADFLDLSRAERNKLKLRLELVAVAEALRSALSALQKVYPDRLQLHLAEGLEACWVQADRSRLIQVVFNLVENAAKYSPQDQPIEIHAQRLAEQAVIEVVDHGQGIPPEALPHVFERFYCVEAAVNYSDSGSSGVGLALVQALVKSMNGEVSVASQPGQGSRFRVTLQRVLQSPEEMI
ncbi:MAG: HAMP domain-containing sensor histidine kinase [Synechococcus sp.]|nr:HAMP domain-containing sensor histidine kinase [Synechococcus sp.]